MTRCALGLHIHTASANHAAADYIRTVMPSMVKWLDGAVDRPLVELARAAGSITVLRVYHENQDRGQLGTYLQAVSKAMAQADFFHAYEVSFNEAHQDAADLAWKAEADIEGMKLAERLGKKAVIGCFSVGMPDVAHWHLYRPALEYAAAGGHYLGLHEYGGGSQGMRLMVTGEGPTARGWAFLRYRRVLDWARGAGVRMPRILITESGIDSLGQADRPTRGWKTMGDGYDYAADLRWASDRLSETPEVAGWCDFGWASADPQWHAFDLSRDGHMLSRVKLSQAALPSTTKPPQETTMPDLNAMLAAEFGATYADLRATLPRNPTGPAGDFSRRALGQIEMLAVHHTVGPKDQSWQVIAQTHVTGRGWAGIGYHIGIRQGAVSYLGDASLARACCADQNHRVLCVVMTGNYEVEPVDKADAEALRRVVAVVQRWSQATLGRHLRVLGHGEVPGQATACPGVNLQAVVRQLAAGGGSAPLPAPRPSSALLVAVDKVHRQQGITLNPTAALQRAIRADGLIPTTRELEVSDAGETWVAQRAESMAGGGATVYYVRKGEWAKVSKMPA